MSDATHSRDDPQRQRADAERPVTTADMLKALDDAELLACVQTVAISTSSRHRIIEGLCAAREVIIEAAPAICRACGELNPWWLLAGGTSVPCWGCGARHLATPPQESADLPPADRATRQPTAAVGRVTGDGGR